MSPVGNAAAAVAESRRRQLLPGIPDWESMNRSSVAAHAGHVVISVASDDLWLGNGKDELASAGCVVPLLRDDLVSEVPRKK
jgi:hypothetical protein